MNGFYIGQEVKYYDKSKGYINTEILNMTENEIITKNNELFNNKGIRIQEGYNIEANKTNESQRRLNSYIKSTQEEKDLRMYVLVNQDININKGKLAGQVGHAVATLFYNQWKLTGKLLPIMDEYMKIQKKIILYCSQSKLEELEKQGYITIRDKGWTDLDPNTLTCVNLGLIDCNKEIPEDFKFVKELKLVR